MAGETPALKFAAAEIMKVFAEGAEDAIDLGAGLALREGLAKGGTSAIKDTLEDGAAGFLSPAGTKAPTAGLQLPPKSALGAGMRAESTEPTKLTLNTLEPVEDFAQRLLTTANRTGKPATGNFGDLSLKANPGDSFDAVIKPFRDADKAAGERIAAREAQEKAAIADLIAQGKVATRPPSDMVLDPRGLRQPGEGGNTNERALNLLTRDQVNALPDNVVVTSTNGKSFVTGRNDEDLVLDTRNGFTSFGFLVSPH